MISVTEQFKQKLHNTRKNRRNKKDLESFISKSINTQDQVLSCLIICGRDFSPNISGLSTRDEQERLDIVRRLFEHCITLANRLNTLLDFVLDINSFSEGKDSNNQRTAKLVRIDNQYFAKASQYYVPLWLSLARVHPVDARPHILSLVTAKEKELKRARNSIISTLIEAYISDKGKNPTTMNELFEFNPIVLGLDVLQKEIEVLVTKCENLWMTLSGHTFTKGKHRVKLSDLTLKEMDKAFKEFSDFVRKKGADPLVYFQILKWIRDAGREEIREKGGQKQTRASRLNSDIWYELYLETVFHALWLSLSTWNILSIQQRPKGKRIVNEDREFFLQPVKKENRFLFELRLSLGESPDSFKEYNRNRRRLNRFADYSGLEYIDEIQTKEIMNKSWKYILNEAFSTVSGTKFEKRIVKTQSMQEIFKDKFTVYQRVLDNFTLIWIEGNDDIYIEFHFINYALFKTNSNGLVELVEEAFFQKIAEIGRQVLSFMMALLEAVGILADIITAIATAGAGAGFRKIIFEYVKIKAQQYGVDTALNLAGVENPALRFAAHIGVDFSKGLAKGVGNKGVPKQSTPGTTGKVKVPPEHSLDLVTESRFTPPIKPKTVQAGQGELPATTPPPSLTTHGEPVSSLPLDGGVNMQKRGALDPRTNDKSTGVTSEVPKPGEQVVSGQASPVGISGTPTKSINDYPHLGANTHSSRYDPYSLVPEERGAFNARGHHMPDGKINCSECVINWEASYIAGYKVKTQYDLGSNRLFNEKGTSLELHMDRLNEIGANPQLINSQFTSHVQLTTFAYKLPEGKRFTVYIQYDVPVSQLHPTGRAGHVLAGRIDAKGIPNFYEVQTKGIANFMNYDRLNPTYQIITHN